MMKYKTNDKIITTLEYDYTSKINEIVTKPIKIGKLNESHIIRLPKPVSKFLDIKKGDYCQVLKISRKSRGRGIEPSHEVLIRF